MATVVINHSKVVTVPDDGVSPVGTDEWNAVHNVTGLENVDNTSDINKPVSTAQAAADAVVAANAASALATAVTNAANASNLTSGTIPAARLPTIGTVYREILTAPRTYFVLSTGNDSNNGLSSGTAFLTIQHAINIIQTTLDINGQSVTISAPSASYAGFVANGPFVGDTPGTTSSSVSVVGQTPFAITGATNATPIVVTFTGASPANGEVVVISGVGGNTAANNSWALAGVSGSTAQLVNSVGNGAYTSGGQATFTSRTTIAGTSSAAAVAVSGGANLNISGLKLSSANVQCAYALGLGSHLFITGPIQGDTCGAGVQQFWATQGALLTISSGMALSGGNLQWAQASHQGQIRWNGTVVGCVANIAYSNCVAYSDFGDFTETGGGSFQTNGYAVTAPFQALIIESGIIQVEGNMPPAAGFFPGSNAPNWTNSNMFGGVPSFAMTATQALIYGGSSGFGIFNSAKTAITFSVSDAGITALGQAGSIVGALEVFNATSGNITISPPAGALGTIVTTWPSVSGTLLSNGGAVTSTSPSGGVGYATGAGGAITQITGRTTAVTLNTVTGQITMFSAAWVVGTILSFTLTDSQIAATDIVVASQGGGANLYQINVTGTAAGSCKISIQSISGTATESAVINFAIVKGVTS